MQPFWQALPILRLKAIDQNTAIFHNRHVVDEEYGGLAFEEEGERCSQLLQDPKVKVMVMGNHGVMVIGDTIAETFDRLYYFERSAETYIKALSTGQPLRELPEEIAEKTAREIENYGDQAMRHFSDLKENFGKGRTGISALLVLYIIRRPI